MKPACEQIQKDFSLLLYGELSFTAEEQVQAHLTGCPDCHAAFDRERAWHDSLAFGVVEPPADLLVKCRQQLRKNLPFHAESGVAGRAAAWFGRLTHNLNWGMIAKPAMGMALVALGYLGAQFPGLADGFSGSFSGTRSGEQVSAGMARVRYVESDGAGNVRILVDETRPRIVSGRADDPDVQQWLVAAARGASDPGLRAETVALLQGGVETADVHKALVAALESDPNAGVRLKALEALRRHSGEPVTRQALMRVLSADDNPGIRTQAIDLLTENSPRSLDTEMVGLLQHLMRSEENGYVRQRCEKALRLANASAEIF